MNICFAIVSNALPIRCRMTKNYKELTKSAPVNIGTELILDTTTIVDCEDSIWIYSPITEMYYELYSKKNNTVLINVYPSMYAEVTSDCKAGLAIYSDSDSNSDITDRKNIGELYEITPVFVIDENKNIWIYSVNINEDILENKNCHISDYVTTGWIIYKNFRNNFANLFIHGQYKSLLTAGKLDKDKVDDFTEWLWEVRFKKWFKLIEPLQLFSNSVHSGVNTVSVTTTSPYKTYTPAETQKNTEDQFDKYHGPHSMINRLTGDIYSKGKILQWNDPVIVQNKRNFPKVKSSSETNRKHNKEYSDIDDKFKLGSKSNFSYKLTDNNTVSSEINKIRARMMFNNDDYDNVMKRNTHYYNRFKVATPGDMLSRGVPHIFFTRPDCNIFSKSDVSELVPKVKADPNFNYAFYHKRYILQQLSQRTKLSDDWMWLLSNKITSFNPTDESISNDTYGSNYYKNSIAYGRTNFESKAAGNFSCNIMDTKELDMFHLHKLWTDYISNVYCGMWIPKLSYLWKKIIDYACSMYYIVTAEDGETIIFWSKYYGVFPVNVPSSAYAWQDNSFISQQSLSITYEYSFKEDYNPQSLIELNLNSNINDDVEFVPVYDSTLGMSGKTWVGSPFVETVKTNYNNDYYFKLRFKKKVKV